MSRARDKVLVWERDKENRRVLKEFKAPYYFYTKSDSGEHKDLFGNKLTKHTFETPREFFEERKYNLETGVKMYESDISSIYKVLSKKYYKKESRPLNYTFYDIEVDYDPAVGFAGPENPYAPVSAVSLYHSHTDKMILLVVLPKNGKWTKKDIPEDLYDIADIKVCKNEKELLLRFIDEIDNSDIISGWNSQGYDDPYMYFRLKMVLGTTFAEMLSFDGAPSPRVKDVEIFKGTLRKQVEIYGRIAIDYLLIFKKFETKERPSNSLDAISEEFLPDLKKIEYDGSLYELYNDDFPTFVRYNVRDTEVLKGLEQILGYMQIAIHNYHDSTCLMNDVLGTVRLVECAMINHCHNELDVIVPDTPEYDYMNNDKFAGALVLPPIVGMHDWVFSVDVNSLYPSTIRSLNISPECIVGQFYDNEKAYEQIYNGTDVPLTLLYENDMSETKTAKEWKEQLREWNYNVSGFGTVFTQEFKGIIPTLLTNWYSDRKEYKKLMKRAKENLQKCEIGTEEWKKYKQESEYYNRVQFLKKLLLNSTYGCLGNKYFKFYDVRMAESTTRSGREFLMHMVKTIAYNLDGEYKWPSPSCIYSDTDSCYAKSFTNNLEETLKLATIIEDKVNVSFPIFATDAFLCNEEYKYNVKAELDTIADRAIFVKKKYYIMHLLYSDGMPKEDMKVMGLQIKKTTIPKKISKKLTKFLEELLTGGEWKEIAKDIVEYKDEIKSVNPIDLGLPKGIKNIEDYHRRYTMKEPNLRLPGHVSAAILYNECLERYNDKESPKISSGMKIKTFYLKKPEGKFKSIALPTDTSKPPEWFKENYIGKIDKNAQILRLVDKPLQSVLDAIGELAPTKKTILVDELFEY